MTVDATFPTVRAHHESRNLAALARMYRDLADDALARYDAGASTLLSVWWDSRLSELVFDRNKACATDIGVRVADAFARRRSMQQVRFEPDGMDPWLETNARIAGQAINDATRAGLTAAESRDDVTDVLDELMTTRRPMHARTMVTAAAGLGATDAARSAGGGAKTWRTTSGNPRSSHVAMNGQTVPINATFSNGLRWPGDGSTSNADEVAGCVCSMTFV